MARPAGILLRFGPYYTDEENVPSPLIIKALVQTKAD